jgi:hypothetical protein
MMKIKFETRSDRETHECESYRTGEWIIFKCPRCTGYEKRLNWQTGQMKTINANDDVCHTGNYFPVEYLDPFRNLN